MIEGRVRWIYRKGRAEIRYRDDGLADGCIDGEYYGEVSP